MLGSGLKIIELRSIDGWLVSRWKGLIVKIFNWYGINSWQKATTSRKDKGSEI